MCSPGLLKVWYRYHLWYQRCFPGVPYIVIHIRTYSTNWTPALITPNHFKINGDCRLSVKLMYLERCEIFFLSCNLKLVHILPVFKIKITKQNYIYIFFIQQYKCRLYVFQVYFAWGTEPFFEFITGIRHKNAGNPSFRKNSVTNFEASNM
jgi:hypothetical protein